MHRECSLKGRCPVAFAILILLAMAVRPLLAQAVTTPLEKYVAWRGGATFRSIRTISERGSVYTDGMHGEISRVVLVDGRYRQSVQLPAYSQTDIVSFGGAWTTNPSGQVVNLSPGEATDLRRLAQLAFPISADSDARLQVQEMAPERRDGMQWSVVRIRFGDPDTYDLFISPATGELHEIRVTADLKTRFINYSDWKLVAGVRMPFVEFLTNENTGETTRVDFTQVDLDAALPADTFNKPRETKPLWRFSDRSRSTAWIPIDFFDQQRIFIPAIVNGHNTEALLDSGADASALDRGFAKSVGALAQGTHTAVGAAGNQESGFVPDISITLDRLTIGPLTGGILDLAGIGRRWGHPLEAILGREIFNDLIVDIDFPNRRIAFRERRDFQVPEGAQRVVLGQYLAIYTIPVSIDGERAVPAMFDLGNGSPLAIFPTYPGRQSLIQSRPHSLQLGGGVGGVHTNIVTTVGTLAMGDNVFHEVPATLPPAGNDIHNSNRVFANIGLPVFSRFRVICDLHKNLLYLVPVKRLLNAPFRKDRSGLQFEPKENGWEVLFVAPGSPAAAGNLKPHDVIIAINGKSTSQIAASTVQSWRWGAIGTHVTLGLSDGSTRQFTLRDYY